MNDQAYDRNPAVSDDDHQWIEAQRRLARAKRKAIGAARYRRCYARHRPAPRPKGRLRYPPMIRIEGGAFVFPSAITREFGTLYEDTIAKIMERYEVIKAVDGRKVLRERKASSPDRESGNG